MEYKFSLKKRKRKIFRVKKELDTRMYTMSNSSLTCGCQVGLILQFSFTHRTDSPGSISIPLCIMSQVGFGHLVQDTHSGDKLPKIRVLLPDSSPADIHHRDKDQSDGNNSAERDRLSPAPTHHEQQLIHVPGGLSAVTAPSLLHPRGLTRYLWIPRPTTGSDLFFLGILSPEGEILVWK